MEESNEQTTIERCLFCGTESVEVTWLDASTEQTPLPPVRIGAVCVNPDCPTTKR